VTIINVLTWFGHDLWVLAMPCVHFDQAQICTQVNASFLPLILASQHKSTQVGLSIVLLSMGAHTRLLWNCFLANIVELACTCESVWPPTTRLRMQVDICVELWLRLVRASCAYQFDSSKFSPPQQPPGHLNFWRLACSNSLPSGPKSHSNATNYM